MTRATAGLLVVASALACGRAPDATPAPTPTPGGASAAPSAASELAAPASAAAPPAPASAAPAVSSSAAVTSRLVKERAPHDFSSGPLYFTPAYDGSLRFSLWLQTMRFARTVERDHGQRPHFTFFVNAAFYTTEVEQSDVGHATTRAEVLVRRALTQLAINDGHEIANHGHGHLDGGAWSADQWAAEISRFHAVLDGTLFEPIRDEEGRGVFPRFEALAGAPPGSAGAACDTDEDCAAGPCVDLVHAKLCSAKCNLKLSCPRGTACGAPMFREDTDLCLPPPALPVRHGGEILFDARGRANPKSKQLVPYRVVGFRAPYLAVSDGLYEALAARGYRYDTSQATSPPEPPYFLSTTAAGGRLLEFALMPHPGALSIPMDYNYRLEKGSPERMRADYRQALLESFAGGRRPWNVGHHFASWGEGTYLVVLEETVTFAAAGCPDEAGALRCEGARVVSFRELADVTAAPRR